MIHWVISDHDGVHYLKPLLKALRITLRHVREDSCLILILDTTVEEIKPGYSLAPAPESDAIERPSEMGAYQAQYDGQ